jgi:hypothetical protein
MVQPHPRIELTELQREALIGSMLGDGHLAICKKAINAHLMIFRATKDKEYLEYEASIFQNYLKYPYMACIKYAESKDGYSFATTNNPAFTEFQSLFYKDKKKIIPPNLELSAISIAHWIADDGSVLFNKLPYRFVVEFSTHGFSEQEVNFLADLLKKRYNEDFLVRPKNRRDKKYFIIKAYDSACRVMFSDIDNHFKMIRKRLWDKPESRFYSDPPERQRSMVKDFAARKIKLSKIIESVDSISIAQLIQELNYKSYGALYNLLEFYLNKQIISIEKDSNNFEIIKVNK